MEGYGNENPGAFQSTRPLRGATLTGMTFREMFGISTHAPLAGRDSGGGTPSAVMVSISTHAPLAGRDTDLGMVYHLARHFNPRAPCGARRIGTGFSIAIFDFNPRAPCGARLCWWSALASRSSNFNPRAPCGARPVVAVPPVVDQNFNPRAPCGARLQTLHPLTTGSIFQPTRPLRGATFKLSIL